MNIEQLFLLGMKRSLHTVHEHVGSDCVALNLGAGKTNIDGAINLDFPEWDATYMPLPFEDESVHTIHAYHFLEHLHGERVIQMLREFQRVLVNGGVANIVVPHRLGQMAIEDLDHKTQFCEETWRNLFRNKYYDKHRELPWQLDVGLNVIMGLNERNLALVTQLVRKWR